MRRRIATQQVWARANMSLLLVMVLVLACAVGQASAQDVEKPQDGAPSFLYFTREAKSPLITDTYPLHKAVALFDLPGVKAALAKGANPNQAVQGGTGIGLTGTYTPMRVALESKSRYGGDNYYMPEILTDIIIQLLCAGARPNERAIRPSQQQSTPLSEIVGMAPYRLVLALMLAGAEVPSADVATSGNCGGRRGMSDIDSALTAAVLAAFGTDVRPQNPTEYYKANNNCVRPASWKYYDGEYYCYALCSIRKNGLTPSEASELRAGRVSPSLATKLELSDIPKKVHYKTLQQVNDGLAKTAATFKACPAVAQRNGKL